jgi:hypothetical protein
MVEPILTWYREAFRTDGVVGLRNAIDPAGWAWPKRRTVGAPLLTFIQVEKDSEVPTLDGHRQFAYKCPRMSASTEPSLRPHPSRRLRRPVLRR